MQIVSNDQLTIAVMRAAALARSERRRGRVFCALLVLVSCLGGGQASAAVIAFDSTPQGAQVCLKKKGVPECYGVTPLKLNAEFAGEHESKRYFIKRIGYQTETRLIAATERAVKVPLKQRDIFLDPEQHASAELKRLQREVNATLGRVIYDPGSPLGRLDIELVGKIRLEAANARNILHVGLVLTNADRRRELGSVRRKHESEERNAGIVRSALNGEAAEMLGFLAGVLQPVRGVHDIILSIDYVKAGAVLADESVHYFRTYATAQYTQATSRGTERVTEYSTFRLRADATKVEDELEIRTVLVNASLDKLARLGPRARDLDAVLGVSTVYLNDNRRKIFMPVKSLLKSKQSIETSE